MITLNVNATYTGYHVKFEYKDTEYDMKVRTGNRGSMTIILISIDDSSKTYKWKYTHKADIFTDDYEYIKKVGIV